MTPEQLKELKTIEFTRLDGTIVVPFPTESSLCRPCELFNGGLIDCEKSKAVLDCTSENKYNQTMIWIKKEELENQS